MEHQPHFDIFSGTIDKDARWVEAVRGLANARERMEELAKKKAGKYFVYSSLSHTVLAMTDTTELESERQISVDDFDVVKGLPHVQPLCLGAVHHFEAAIELMYRMYTRIPGDYFVRRKITNEVVASIQCDSRRVRTSGPPIDILRGVQNGNAVWVEAVEDLVSAGKRMEELRTHMPGSYFVFSRRDRTILACYPTATREPSRERGSAA
jgi:hypothetical protein